MTDWNYRETPLDPGFYATLYCWDFREGMFPGAAEWLDGRWVPPRPVIAWQGPFPDEESADWWARAHDPEPPVRRLGTVRP